MNERGFVTTFALCMMLVIALVVKGVQESDTNHNYESNDLQTEFDLQNAADGGIYEAAEKVSNNPNLLPINNIATTQARNKNQKKLLTRTITTARGKITVTVWGERLQIQGYTPTYTSQTSRGYPVTTKDPETGDKIPVKYGYMLFSLAEMTGDRIGGKIYRRAFAYVVDGVTDLNQPVNEDVADKNVIHFMEPPSVNYYKSTK